MDVAVVAIAMDMAVGVVHLVSVWQARSVYRPGAVVCHSSALQELCSVQTRSRAAVATPVIHCVAVHCFATVHVSPLSMEENVLPATHAEHERSLDADPMVDKPWPAGHVFHVTQASSPAELVKVPAVHGAHLRFDEVVAYAEMR